MAVEPITGLPYQEANSLQTDVLQNQQLNYFAAWSNAVVQTVGDNSPPGSPTNGHRYVIGTSPSGAWSGKAKYLAVYRGGWQFYAPYSGAVVYNLGDGKPYQYIASAWAIYAGVVGPTGPTGPAGNSLTRKRTTLTSTAGSAVIDLSTGDEVYVITLTENTTITFTNLPASGYAAEVRVRVTQHASAAKTCVFDGTSEKYAGGAWTVSSVLSSVEDIGVAVDSSGNLTLYPSGVLV